jgi:hypothetical protein
MDSPITWFDIPVSDIGRATELYEHVTGQKLKRMKVDSAKETALFESGRRRPWLLRVFRGFRRQSRGAAFSPLTSPGLGSPNRTFSFSLLPRFLQPPLARAP